MPSNREHSTTVGHTAVLVLLDVLIIAFGAAAVLVFAQGPIDLRPNGFAIRARTPVAPLMWAILVVVLRIASGPKRGRVFTLGQGALLGLRRRLGALEQSRIRWLVFGIVAIAAALRLLNLFGEPGFATGDDVEIQTMAFGRLFHVNMSLWQIRSPFFPMMFIYPAERIASVVFGDGARAIIACGRLVVTGFSVATVALVHRVTRREAGSAAVGLIAALLVAINQLLVHFGGSEFPRPVAGFFVLAAFAVLTGWSSRPSRFAAGLLLGIGASVRFSELVAFGPAGVSVLLRKDWRGLVVVGCGALSAIALVLGVGDWLFWGQPFHSLREIIDYTLVNRESSRGFQPFYGYLVSVGDWADPLVVGLALVPVMRGNWELAVWSWGPLVLLSLLPHKEPRYLIPSLPFIAMSAAWGAWQLGNWIADGKGGPLAKLRRPVALALTLGVPASCVWQIANYRFVKSKDWIVPAEYIAARRSQTAVVFEDSGTWGAQWLYIRGRRGDSIREADMGQRALLMEKLKRSDVEWVALRSEDIRRHGYSEMLASLAFESVPMDRSTTYALYHREHPLGAGPNPPPPPRPFDMK